MLGSRRAWNRRIGNQMVGSGASSEVDSGLTNDAQLEHRKEWLAKWKSNNANSLVLERMTALQLGRLTQVRTERW